MDAIGTLTGKTALVTGGAKRVGAAICRRLHAAGANVMVNYLRSGKAARGLVAEFNAQRANSAAMIKADLLHADAPARLIKTTLQTFGRLDVVVNNASSFYPTPVGQLNEAAWHDLIGTNLKAPLFLSQAAAPALRRTGGAIVNIVDIHVDRPLKNYLVYCAAKAGLAGLTRALARELDRDVKNVHTDIQVLVEIGLVERAGRRIRVPFDEIRTEFVVRKAA